MADYVILFVDDEANTLSSIKRLLMNMGEIEVLTAENAASAHALFLQKKIDIVISDENMPEKKGSDFLAEIKEKYPKTLRILSTGYVDIDFALSNMRQGTVYRYFSKPWDNDNLKMVLLNAIQYLKLRDS